MRHEFVERHETVAAYLARLLVEKVLGRHLDPVRVARHIARTDAANVRE
jgi:hypothetical protein